MDLYVIRHADAVQLGENSLQVDADRQLTAKGLEQTNTIAVGLQAKGVPLQLILSSPLLRARQTAEGIVKAWTGTAPEIKICDQLTPGKRPRKLARALKELEQKTIAIIGHEPDLSAWTAWVIGSKKAQLALAKAGIAHVKCEDGVGRGTGTLVHLLTPEWLV